MANTVRLNPSVGEDWVIDPPARQRAAGFALLGAAVWIAALLMSSPGFVVVLGIIGATLLASAGMALAVPKLRITADAMVIRNSWGRKRKIGVERLASVLMVTTRPPWRIVVATGWPLPHSFSTLTCELTLSNGEVVRVEAMQSIRIPILRYLVTLNPDEASGLCESLVEMTRRD